MLRIYWKLLSSASVDENHLLDFFWSEEPLCSQTWDLPKKITPPDLQAKNLHRQFYLISTVLVTKKTQKISENEEIYTAGKSFTLPSAVTALTNSTSVYFLA